MNKSSGRPVAIVFPDYLPQARANLGFNFLCQTVNQRVDTTAKIFTLDKDIKDLTKCNLIFLSLPFEDGYHTAVRMLLSAGIPWPAQKRKNKYPLIVAGGIAPTLNPLPMSHFVDLFLLGDGECNLTQFLEIWSKTWRDPRDNQKLIETAVSDIAGAYAPYIKTIRQKITIPLADTTTIEPVHSHFEKKEPIFSSTDLIEITRGCPVGCRFCAIGYHARPPRFFDAEKIIQTLEKSGLLNKRRIGLVGAAAGLHPSLTDICSYLAKNCANITLSSMSFFNIKKSLLSVLEKSGPKTITLALEAGSEKLRRAINKPISHNSSFETIHTLATLKNINKIKIYAIIGLPEETKEDVTSLINWAETAAKILSKNKKHLTLSIQPFVPKPKTPFQWVAMQPTDIVAEKIKMIKKLKIKNLELNISSPRTAARQALYSTGDENIHKLILHNAKIIKMSKKELLEIERSLFQEKPADYIFPWDFIEHPVSKNFLRNEFEKSKKAIATPFCNPSVCRACGAC